MDDSFNWPEAIAFLGLVIACIVFLALVSKSFLEWRRMKISSGQEDDLRQLVRRYEQLAENTLDAQQRTAADVSEMRSRTASIEQILRTVE
jgi:hypothetical protein